MSDFDDKLINRAIKGVVKIVADRDEWKEQHENLLSVRQSDTREQVVQWIQRASTQVVDHDFAGNPITDGSVLLMGAYGPLVIRAITIARADLEATVKSLEQSVEFANRIYQDLGEETDKKITDLEATIADLQSKVDFWIANRNELQEKDDAVIAEQQAYIEQLREACELASICHEAEDSAMPHPEYQSLRQCSIDTITKALALPHDNATLHEHDAKLVERIAHDHIYDIDLMAHHRLQEIADKIMEGKF